MSEEPFPGAAVGPDLNTIDTEDEDATANDGR